MDDRTESFESYEPESYEWDYEEAGDRPPRVLWGRIIALIAFVALAFWLGRSTAPTGNQEEALARVTQDLEQAESEIEDLEAQLAELNAAAETEPSPEPTSESSPEASGEEETYTVKSGDSLAAIALKFYGDSSLADVIADANGIDDAQSIKPGDVLIIPPQP